MTSTPKPSRAPHAGPFLVPNWSAPATVQALFSTRTGGVSEGSYASLNLGDHVGDAPAAVAENRSIFAAALQGAKPVFLQQVHGVDCLPLVASPAQGSMADACSTQAADVACTIMVADCLPLLFCNAAGTQVAAAHAGWRGLAAGVVEQTLRAFLPKNAAKPAWVAMENEADEEQGRGQEQEQKTGLMAWLGPCIGQAAFEVGAEVRAAFMQQYPWSTAHFAPGAASGKWLCDLAGIARSLLQRLGVAVYGNDGSVFWCTYSNREVWFSHRRESQQAGQSGRMAAAVWIKG